jgi:hypothetical protein
MKSVFVSAMLATAMAAVPGVASAATVINFDVDGLGNVIASNTSITNQYANLGVTFRGIEDEAPVNINAAPDPDGVPAPSAPNVLTNCDNAGQGCPGNRADIVQILFAGAASNISFQLDTLGGESVTFNLFDGNDMLLETLSVSSNGSVFVPVSFSASGVRRIDGLQPNDGWAWAMDDLSFDGGVVPEPASWAMMIAGFGLVGAAARRNRARVLA